MEEEERGERREEAYYRRKDKNTTKKEKKEKVQRCKGAKGGIKVGVDSLEITQITSFYPFSKLLKAL